MDAIYRVDGNRVLTSPDAAGPWDARHAARLGAGGAGGVGGRSDPDAGADAHRARHHRPDAAGADRAVDARNRSAARGPQDPALRGQAARRQCRRGRRDRAQGQDRRRWPCRRTWRTSPVDAAGARSGAAPSSRDFSGSPFVDGNRPCARPAAASACPVRARSGTGSTGRWSRVLRSRRRCARWSPRISATAPPPCWISGKWTFINADLTVSMARPPVGEWILLDAESWIGPDGAGLAMARLGRRARLFRTRGAKPGDRAAVTQRPVRRMPRNRPTPAAGRGLARGGPNSFRQNSSTICGTVWGHKGLVRG